MSKLLLAGLTALFMTSAAAVHAQTPLPPGVTPDIPSDADMKAFTDRRIEVLKAVLQLTPDQQKYWPALEAAIRERADARRTRLENLATIGSGQREVNPVDLLRQRANNLSQRGASLNKLVDAWQPLYQSLDDSQRQRLRFFSMVALREMRDALESRRLQYYDEEDDD